MPSTSLSPVAPALPVAPYLGGKRNLARRLTAIIEATPHDGYAEPFVGMGGIFLRRRMRPKVEVINDLSGDVVNLFRMLQEHPRYFADELALRFSSRAEFERLKRVDPAGLTELQRAVRFLYLQRLAFGGKVAGRNFGVDSRSRAAFDPRQMRPMLERVAQRLASVVIEQLPFDAFLARYDRPGMLFYLDPPYWGCETDYGEGMFSRGDFARMADQLGGLQGRFLLSINDRPEVREIFGRFDIQAVITTYGVCKGGQTAAAELVISNRRAP